MEVDLHSLKVSRSGATLANLNWAEAVETLGAEVRIHTGEIGKGFSHPLTDRLQRQGLLLTEPALNRYDPEAKPGVLFERCAETGAVQFISQPLKGDKRGGPFRDGAAEFSQGPYAELAHLRLHGINPPDPTQWAYFGERSLGLPLTPSLAALYQSQGASMRLYPLPVISDPTRFASLPAGTRERVRHEGGIGEGELLFVTLARIVPVKRIDRSIVLASKVGRLLGRQVYLWVAGSMGDWLVGPDASLRDDLERQARNLRVALHFMGPVADVGPIYAASDVVVSLPDHETFGIVPEEGALARRLMVVSEYVDPDEVNAIQPEVYGDFRFVAVEPPFVEGVSDETAQAVVEHLQNKELTSALLEHNWTAAQRYTPAGMRDQLIGQFRG